MRKFTHGRERFGTDIAHQSEMEPLKRYCASRIAPAVLAGLCALTGCDKSDQQAAAEAQREAEGRAQRAQLDANEKISEAKHEAEKVANDAARDRSEARVSLQKDVDAVDRKISYLKERVASVSGAAKRNADVAQKESEARRSTLQTGFRKLETETGAAWDQAKASVESDIKALKASVDSWETSVTGKPAP